MSLPAIILPGYFASAKEYQALEDLLQANAIIAITVPLTTWDWVPTLGGRSMQSILAKIDDTVQRVKADYGCDRVNLVGHSAGGWIARIYLGDRPYDAMLSSPDQVNCMTGRISIEPRRALGIRAAILRASSRSFASTT